jgi:hypothetical protein
MLRLSRSLDWRRGPEVRGQRGRLLIIVTAVAIGPPLHARNRSDVDGVVNVVAS